MNAAHILILFFCGSEAARVRMDASKVAQDTNANQKAFHLKQSAIKAWQAQAAEAACHFDKEAARNPEANASVVAAGASELTPSEFNAVESATAKCRSARNWRAVKVCVGAPLMIVSAELVFIHYGVYAEALNLVGVAAGSVGQAITTVVEPIATVLTDVVGTTVMHAVNALQPVAHIIAAAVPLGSSAILAGSLYLTMNAVVIWKYFSIAVPLAAKVFMAPYMAALSGSEALTSMTVEQISLFLGHGANLPSCCCAPVAPGDEAYGKSCAVVAMSDDAPRNADVCPSGWTRDPAQCATPEIIQYSKQTVQGCQCKDATECAANEPYDGHAWCKVEEPSNCGWQSWSHPSNRWDHCRVDGQPLKFSEGKSRSSNDALATFIPNAYETHMLPIGPDSVFSLGTWVDSNAGLATGKRNFFAGSQCFVGVPVETLIACARMCLEHGAPTAKTMDSEANIEYKCVAFAFHRTLHLCVRLPEFAADAQFKPTLREWNGDGWMNFVSKHHGRDIDAVCPAKTLLNIRNSGYTVVRDKNNGHLYVQCASSESVQKVSCLTDECEYKSDWCFVHNNCRSGVPVWLGGCGRLTDLQALKCSGMHGAIVPDNGSGQTDEYWDAQNTLARCWNAGAVRSVKAVVGALVLVHVGEFFRVSYATGGMFSTYVSNTFTATFSPIMETVVTVGTSLNSGLMVVGAPLSAIPVLAAAWYVVAGFFTAIYFVGGFFLALVPAVAATLGPVIGATFAATKLPEVGIDVLAMLVGYGPVYPKCCCPDQLEIGGILVTGTNKICAITATNVSLSTGLQSQCPPGWSHDATQCTVPEMVRYSDVGTLGGCKCNEFTECSTNAPYHGHAWCYVKGDSCGHTYSNYTVMSTPWDYCLVDGKPLAYAQGTSSTTNDALASFIPNEFSRGDLFGPSNPLKLGTWTDPYRGITTAKPIWNDPTMSRICFAAVPVETLGACAKMCLEEGAPDASTMSSSTEHTAYPCVAFAYNRADNLCVRLPAFASDAKYTPMLHMWDGEGWQNFVSKFFGKNLESSCPAMTLLDIRDKGYAVARDKNNGHLYLRCAGPSEEDQKTHKASCVQSECAGSGRDSTWCFVDNGCGRWGNACEYIGEQDPLGCKQR